MERNHDPQPMNSRSFTYGMRVDYYLPHRMESGTVYGALNRPTGEPTVLVLFDSDPDNVYAVSAEYLTKENSIHTLPNPRPIPVTLLGEEEG